MNRNLFLNAVGKLDDEIIEKHFKKKEELSCAKKRASRKTKALCIKVGALAACICLAIAMIAVLQKPKAPMTEPPGITFGENGVTVPKKNVSLSSGDAADMISFFIYNGNCYTGYMDVEGHPELVGDKLGTATGMIDEWTPEDGYVDLAGTVRGDIYTVNGYDPSFMLCMSSLEQVRLFICDSGFTVKYGSELFEDRLHLAGNYESVTYETRESWYYCKKEVHELTDAKQSAVSDLIAALNGAEFIPLQMLSDGYGTDQQAKPYPFGENEIYHVYFHKADGTTVHLRLQKDGYVIYQGIIDICVKVPEKTYNSFTALLNTN